MSALLCLFLHSTALLPQTYALPRSCRCFSLGIVKQAVVLFFHGLDHVVGVLVIRRGDAKFLSHTDERTGEHLDFGVAVGVQILQSRVPRGRLTRLP